jgi:hypothetical protein
MGFMPQHGQQCSVILQGCRYSKVMKYFTHNSNFVTAKMMIVKSGHTPHLWHASLKADIAQRLLLTSTDNCCWISSWSEWFANFSLCQN